MKLLYLAEGGVSGDGLEASCYGDGVTLSVDNPWAGSSEAGFGETCSVRLDKDQVQQLAAWLTEAAKECVNAPG